MSLVANLRDVVGFAADRALDLTLPATCAGCYREGTALCRECRAVLDVRRGVAPGGSVGLAAGVPEPLFQLEWCAPFTGVAQRAVTRLSDAGERRLGGPLGEAIAHRWATAGAGGDMLVPVPVSTGRVRDCGYDQAALLARAAGRRLRLPVVEALVRTPDVAGAFEVIAAERIRDHWVVLVDDVVTTGATLAACATALLRAGAQVVSAVTVARDRWAALNVAGSLAGG